MKQKEEGKTAESKTIDKHLVEEYTKRKGKEIEIESK